MGEQEQVRYLEEKLGIYGVNPNNVEVSGNSVVIKSGNAILDSRTGIDITLNGGKADVGSYSGEITLSVNGGSVTTIDGKTYNFGNGGSIVIQDGKIISIKNGELIEGDIGGNNVKGSGIDYDAGTKTLTTKEGGSVRLNDIEYLSESNGKVTIKFDSDGNVVSGKGIVAIDVNKNEIIAKFSGTVKNYYGGHKDLYAGTSYTVYVDGKESKTYSVAQLTQYSAKVDWCNHLVSCIQENNENLIITTKNNNQIGIKVFDNSVRNLKIDEITDGSRVVYGSNNAELDFSRNPLIARGDITKIGTSFETTHNGVKYDFNYNPLFNIWENPQITASVSDLKIGLIDYFGWSEFNLFERLPNLEEPPFNPNSGEEVMARLDSNMIAKAGALSQDFEKRRLLIGEIVNLLGPEAQNTKTTNLVLVDTETLDRIIEESTPEFLAKVREDVFQMRTNGLKMSPERAEEIRKEVEGYSIRELGIMGIIDHSQEVDAIVIKADLPKEEAMTTVAHELLHREIRKKFGSSHGDLTTGIIFGFATISGGQSFASENARRSPSEMLADAGAEYAISGGTFRPKGAKPGTLSGRIWDWQITWLKKNGFIK
ncbi:hypothetical protein HYW20_05440 [Candidatus Woesearchaeota archaeon]|nr:hypothetical protein [Candidatus Woesearchaeota archaeon]